VSLIPLLLLLALYYSYLLRKDEGESIDDSVGTTNGRGHFQHLLRLMAKKSISETETEVEAYCNLLCVQAAAYNIHMLWQNESC
jgi:hypothetical protein